MLHLSAERLAALADSEPTAAEAAHLGLCSQCASERLAHRELLACARGAYDRPGPPLTTWEAVAGRLRDEGMLRETDPSVVPLYGAPGRRTGRLAARRWVLRAAAVVVVVAGSVMAGRVSAGAAPLPTLAFGADGAPAARADGDSLRLGSTEQALAVLNRAERDYRAAAAFLAVHDSSGQALDRPEVYRARLAALDEVAAVTRAALHDAPHDPVINQYYLASLGAREATLRQLGTVLPQGV